jgi:uncharacterized protein
VPERLEGGVTMLPSNTSVVDMAPRLRFNASEIATEVVASLGARGGGKSNGAAVMVEALLDAGIQVIAVDYVGIWFSLRLGPDGKTPSRFKIPVLGGPHGDVALASGAGSVVAEALAERHSSAVLDLSSFSKQERMRFFTDFAESFFRAKKRHPGPVQLLLEESQRFCPQRVMPDQARMLGAVEEIAEVGRNYGIGLHLISQRPQKVNKDVLNLADTVIGYRTLGVLERKAIGEWVQEKGAGGREEVQDELPSLERGRAIVWSPSRKIFGRYDVYKKSTYDAGATPVHARADVATSPLDLGELERAMGRVVQEAEKNDPARLRAEVARLRTELEKCSSVPVVKEVRVPEVPSDLAKKIREISREVAGHEADLRGQVDRARRMTASLSEIEEFMKNMVSSREEGGRRSSHSATQLVRKMCDPKELRDLAEPSTFLPPAKLTKCARSLLKVMAQRHVATYSQLAILSGYSRKSSGFHNSVSELRTAGMVEGGRDSLKVTPRGAVAAGDVEELPTGAELVNYWANRLGRCESSLLQMVYLERRLTRDRLAELTEYSPTSSGFHNGLSTLRTLGLVSGVKGGDVEISDVFGEGST